MAIELQTLKRFDRQRFLEIGEGFTSNKRYAARKVETAERVEISLELETLAQPYVKHWEYDEGILREYATMVTFGLSVGMYDGKRLIGLGLCEPEIWNRTLWVREFHVDAAYRRQGIGTEMMGALFERAAGEGLRVVVCEAQSTNFPAITFYRRLGFEIDAVDLSYYTNHDAAAGEVAVFMKRKL